MPKRLTTEEFIQKAKLIHGGKYRYDQASYVDAYTNVRIFCCACQAYFFQKPVHHLSNKGCFACGSRTISEKLSRSTDGFIKKAISIHGYDYGYDQVSYTRKDCKVIILCRSCNEYFSQIANNHLRGQGCPKCRYKKLSKLNSSSTVEFTKKAVGVHGKKYNYSLVHYKNSLEKVRIICNGCGHEFSQSPGAHIGGSGCPHCVHKREKFVGEILLSMFSRVARQAPVKIGGRVYKFDYQIQDFNRLVYVECNGEQHYFPVDFANKGSDWAQSLFLKNQENDRVKARWCSDMGHYLITVPYWVDDVRLFIEQNVSTMDTYTARSK